MKQALTTRLHCYARTQANRASQSLHRGYRALAARAKHDPTASHPVQGVAPVGQEDPVAAMTILREHPLIEPGLRRLGKERSGRIQDSQRGVFLKLEGPCGTSREALRQRRRRRGCASPAPLPGRRGKWDRPGLRDYGYSRNGREDALQPRRRRLPSPVRGRQRGVRAT